jgi:hypothetical protein
MDKISETTILITKPSIKIICVGLLGTIFFGAFIYLMLPPLLSSKVTVTGIDYKTGIIMTWALCGVFVFFSLYSLWTILYIKIIKLTDKNLIIKMPFLLLNKFIPLNNIKIITEKDFQINPLISGRTINVYNGRQIIIEFKNGKKIKLNSYEIPQLRSLTSKLNKLSRSSEKMKLENNEDTYQNKYEGYGWLIFILILTLGLVYSIIIKHL